MLCKIWGAVAWQCSLGLLEDKIKKREDEDPDKINEVPVESRIFQHRKAVLVDLILEYQYKADPKKGHSDDDMDTVETGDDIIESIEYIEARRAIDQDLGVGIDPEMNLVTPLEIFVDKKDDATEKGKPYTAQGQLITASLHGGDGCGHRKTRDQEDYGIDGPDDSVKFFATLGKVFGVAVEIDRVEDKEASKKDDLAVKKEPHADADSSAVLGFFHDRGTSRLGTFFWFHQVEVSLDAAMMSE